MSKKLLLTGAAGFSGAHIVRHIMENTDWEIVSVDRLNYAGSLERLAEYKNNPRLSHVFHDFRAAFPAPVLHKLEGVDFVIHAGAETHVENSLVDPLPFVESNVLGTLHVLDAARAIGVEQFIYVSTDEVHGPADPGVSYKEDATIRPSNPYSASKAGGEALAYAYWRSFRLPVTITRTMNLFGERQHPEKFVPMTIKKIRDGQVVVVHGGSIMGVDNFGSAQVVGSRKWLHARNQADALLFVLTRLNANVIGRGDVYHIAGEEHTNLEIAQYIAESVGKSLSFEIVDFHSSRPGHDLRYSLDDSRLRSRGWAPPIPFRDSLDRTVRWTLDHPEWLANGYSKVAKEAV